MPDEAQVVWRNKAERSEREPKHDNANHQEVPDTEAKHEIALFLTCQAKSYHLSPKSHYVPGQLGFLGGADDKSAIAVDGFRVKNSAG